MKPTPRHEQIKEASQQLANIGNDDNRYHNDCKIQEQQLLVEINTAETGRLDQTRPPPTTNPRPTLKLSYTVIAPLVPILLQSNDEGRRELQQISNTNEGSISSVN